MSSPEYTQMPETLDELVAMRRENVREELSMRSTVDLISQVDRAGRLRVCRETLSSVRFARDSKEYKQYEKGAV